MNIQLAILITFFSVCLKLPAQPVWDLNRCLRYALENNTAIKSAELSQHLQKIQYNQARLNLLPQIGAETSVTESFGRSVDPATNTYADINNFSNSYSIGASITLFSGFIQHNKIAFEKYMLRVEQNKTELQKHLTNYSVIEAYFGYVLNNGILNLQKENIQLMQQQHLMVLKYIKAGRKAESDIYEFAAKMATDSFLLIQQTGKTEKALLNLKSVMNFPLSDTLKIDTQFNTVYRVPDSLLITELLDSAAIHVPTIKITENRLLAAKKLLAQSRGSLLPAIEAYSGWNTNYFNTSGNTATAFNQQFTNNAGQYFGISIRIPIFGKFSKINTMRSAHIQLKMAENELIKTIELFNKEINEAYIDWQTSKNEDAAAQKLQKSCEIAFLTAEKKFSIGQLNVIEFFIQKNALLHAQTEVLRTRLQLALKEHYIHFLLSGNWNLNDF